MSSLSSTDSRTGDDISIMSSMTITANNTDDSDKGDNDDRKSNGSDDEKSYECELQDYYNEKGRYNNNGGKGPNKDDDKDSDITRNFNVLEDLNEKLGANHRNKIELFMPKCGSFEVKNEEVHSYNGENNEYYDNEFDDDVENEVDLKSEDETDEEKIKRKSIKEHEKLAKEYLSDNNADEAIGQYVRCITLVMGGWKKNVEDVEWKDCIESCSMHLRIARIYQNMKGCPNQALEHCQTSESSMEALDKKFTNFSFIQSLNEISNGKNSIEDFPESHSFNEDIFEDYQKYKNSFKHHLFLINLSFIRASAYLSLKKFKKSERLLIKCRKLLSRLQNKTPKNQSQIIQCLQRNVAESFVKLYDRMGKPETALEHLQRRMDMGGYDDDSEQLASFYYTMGRLQQSKGDDEVSMEKALESYMKSHCITCKRHSENSIQAADSSYKIALKLITTGVCDDVAETYLKDSIEIYKRVYGLSDVRTLVVMDEKAKMMMRKEEVKEATELLEETYQHKRMIFSQYSPHISTHLKIMATCYLALNQSQKALQLFKQCYNIEKVAYPKKHKKRVGTAAKIQMLQQAYKNDSL